MTEAEQQNFLPSHTVNIQVDDDDDDVNEGEEPTFVNLREEFAHFPLVQFMQYSNKLVSILRNFVTLRHRLHEFVAIFGFGPKEVSVSSVFK